MGGNGAAIDGGKTGEEDRVGKERAKEEGKKKEKSVTKVTLPDLIGPL